METMLEPLDYLIRRMRRSDLGNGLEVTLSFLSHCPTIAEEKKDDILLNLGPTIVYVAVIDNVVIGTAMGIIIQHITRGGARSMMIEDVAVRPKFRGRGIGQALVRALLNEAHEKECYKVTLDCRDELVPFYAKSGFWEQGSSMRINLT